MRIFIAGATGIVGRRLMALLVADGHEVVGTTTSPAKLATIERAGARGVVLDALDRDAVFAAVRRARPDVVVHELTRLTQAADFRRLDEGFAQTNRLRTTGLDNLLEAAREAGAGRFLAQSFAGWPYARSGGPVKTEQDPLDPDRAPAARQTLAAITHVDRAVPAAEGLTGLALRYGLLYGPGTAISADGAVTEMVRRRRLPIVGDGAGVWSFVHVDDAALATAAAVTRGEAGVYNIVDDEPAPVAEWLPFLARALGARPPRRVPVWLVRPLIGEQGVRMMTQSRGASNAKARRELGWQLTYPTWREGFVRMLSQTDSTVAA